MSPSPSQGSSQENVERSTVCPSEKMGFLREGDQMPAAQPQESVGAALTSGAASLAVRMQMFSTGYHFPPKYPLKEQTEMVLVSFWNFYNTGFGFFLTMYSLNVIAWGGMLFLLLCNAAPRMCWVNGHFDCNDIESPRRLWIEIDSQILNGLFCVTGMGLAPWRFRDLYFLLKYRIGKDQIALRRLAGIYRGWFRIEGSQDVPPHLGPKNIEEETTSYNPDCVPYPLDTIAEAPLTGIRAPPTKLYKLDLVIYFNVANTLLQCCLAAFMWALDRYNRPSWSTGFFVCIACIVAAAGGIIMAVEGKRVKAIEGVPLSKRDLERLRRDEEKGILHYNNIKDMDPEEIKRKKEERKGISIFGFRVIREAEMKYL
ncbi:hypothetical protein F5X96DRAFT_463994 [Biscogniauxia mediterranea]|nr:hypothetical protein F5X96DRAFT_463994 [Biscogniauxia mediterranea]